MPIEIGDSTATVRSKINAVLTDAGLNPADNVDTTAATNLLNQVATLWDVDVNFVDRMPEAEFREAFTLLEGGGVVDPVATFLADVDPADKFDWNFGQRSSLFQDTAGSSPVVADGQAIALVKNQNGSTDLVQATASNRPSAATDAATFDGVNDRFLGVTAPAIGSLFIRAKQSAPLLRFLMGALSVDEASRFWVYLNASGHFAVRIGTGGAYTYTAGGDLTGVEHVFGAVWDGTTVKAVLDGVVVGSVAQSGSAVIDRALGVASQNASSMVQFWNGDMGRVVGAAKVATTQEISDICAAMIGAPLGPQYAAINEYGRYRGDWNTGSIAITRNVAFVVGDIVSNGGEYHYCITSYATSSSSSDPEDDAIHWLLLPDPLRSSTLITRDDFDIPHSPFSSGTLTPEGIAWHVTGAGSSNAIVHDGYAASPDAAEGSTYFVLPGLPKPVFKVRARVLDGASAPIRLFTLAVGHWTGTQQRPMVHPNWQDSTVLDFKGQGANANPVEEPTSPLVKIEASLSIPADTWHVIETRLLGRFAFTFMDGVRVGVLVGDQVLEWSGDRTSCFVQIHGSGDQRIDWLEVWTDEPTP